MSDKKHMRNIAVAVGLMVEGSTLEPDLEDLVLGAKALRRRYDDSKARIAELEGARAKAAEGAAPGFAEVERVARKSAKWAHIDRGIFAGLLVELDRRADVIGAQAAELAAWQPFADLLRSRWGMRDDEAATAFADRLVHEQAAELSRLRSVAIPWVESCSHENEMRLRDALVSVFCRTNIAQAEPQGEDLPADREGGGR